MITLNFLNNWFIVCIEEFQKIQEYNFEYVLIQEILLLFLSTKYLSPRKRNIDQLKSDEKWLNMSCYKYRN